MTDDIKEKTDNKSLDKFDLAKLAVERAILREQNYSSQNKPVKVNNQKDDKASIEKPSIVVPIETKEPTNNSNNEIKDNQTSSSSTSSEEKTPFIEKLKLFFKKIWASIVKFFKYIWSKIKQFAQFLWKYIKIAAIFVWKKIKQFITFLKKKFSKNKDESSASTDVKETSDSESNEEKTDYSTENAQVKRGLKA